MCGGRRGALVRTERAERHVNMRVRRHFVLPPGDSRHHAATRAFPFAIRIYSIRFVMRIDSNRFVLLKKIGLSIHYSCHAVSEVIK